MKICPAQDVGKVLISRGQKLLPSLGPIFETTKNMSRTKCDDVFLVYFGWLSKRVLFTQFGVSAGVREICKQPAPDLRQSHNADTELVM